MASSVLAVSLNAAIDKTYLVSGFRLNRVHRPAETHIVAGGKGINVARVYRGFGGEAMVTGFLGGGNGEYIAKCLDDERIPHRFVRVSGESRLCIAVVDPDAVTQTEINENGPEIQPEEYRALLALVRELLPQSRAVVLSGSAPPGTPGTVYRDIVNMAQEEFGVPAVLDASGETLRLTMAARPQIVKPNVHELAALGIDGSDPAAAARELRHKFDLSIAIVTAGSKGAVVATEAGTWWATPPSVRVLSAVGSGDSLCAAFLWGMATGRGVDDALRLAVAAGAANATTYGAGYFSNELAAALAEDTVVKRID